VRRARRDGTNSRQAGEARGLKMGSSGLDTGASLTRSLVELTAPEMFVEANPSGRGAPLQRGVFATEGPRQFAVRGAIAEPGAACGTSASSNRGLDQSQYRTAGRRSLPDSIWDATETNAQ
jgi:hypothetical protein